MNAKVRMKHLALIIMDMQKGFLSPWNNPEEEKKLLINSVIGARDYCQQTGIKIFYVELPRFGETIPEILPARGQANIFRKARDHLFMEEGTLITPNSEITCPFREALGDINKLVFAGIHGKLCISYGMFGAIERGYKVITSSDLIANNFSFDQLGTRENMLQDHREAGWLAQD